MVLSFKATSSPFGCSVPPRLPAGCVPEGTRRCLGRALLRPCAFTWAVQRSIHSCLLILILFCVFEKDHSSRVDSRQPPDLLF